MRGAPWPRMHLLLEHTLDGAPSCTWREAVDSCLVAALYDAMRPFALRVSSRTALCSSHLNPGSHTKCENSPLPDGHFSADLPFGPENSWPSKPKTFPAVSVETTLLGSKTSWYMFCALSVFGRSKRKVCLTTFMNVDVPDADLDVRLPPMGFPVFFLFSFFLFSFPPQPTNRALCQTAQKDGKEGVPPLLLGPSFVFPDTAILSCKISPSHKAKVAYPTPFTPKLTVL